MTAKFLFTERASVYHAAVRKKFMRALSELWDLSALGSCFPGLEVTVPCWTTAHNPDSPHGHPGTRQMHQFLLQVTGLPHKAKFSCHHRDALDWGWEEHLQLPKQNVLEQPFKEAIKVKEAGRSASFCTIHSLEWIISSSNLPMPLNMVPKYACVSMCVTITEMKRLRGDD